MRPEQREGDGMAPTAEQQPEWMHRTILTHCPQCQAVLNLDLSIVAKPVSLNERRTEEDSAQAAASKYTGAQASLIEEAKRKGLLTAFEQAVLRRSGASDNTPRSIEDFLLTWLRKARPVGVPRWALDTFSATLGGHITIYGTDGVCGVASNKRLRMFCPSERIRSTPTKKIPGVTIVDASPASLNDWIRTRWGYVVSEGAMFEDMKKKSFGEWARPLIGS